MAKIIQKLTARRVATETGLGPHGDGGNLFLIVKKTKRGTLSRRWSFIYYVNGRRRELGLGSSVLVSLGQARKLAVDARNLLSEGIDPIEARRLKRTEGMTFGQFAPDLVESLKPKWKNEKHTYQWERSINVEAKPLHPLPLNKIKTDDVLSVLKPIWLVKPETAMRTRQRIEHVLDAAKAKGLRNGDNPARWGGNLEFFLKAPDRQKRQHHLALPFKAAPEFMRQLAERNALSARALEFTILTASRAGEAMRAQWAEFDLQAAIWTVPAERMKGGVEHRVPLAQQAIDLLLDLKLKAAPGAVFVFANPGAKQPLTNAAMIELLKRMEMTDITVHGFRSTFRDWAAAETEFAWEVMEGALAHRVGSSVARAYARGDALEKRRGLMQVWADYCLPPVNNAAPMAA